MAGIGAVSPTKTHAAAGADVNATGFVTKEQIALTADISGSGYAWSVAIPAASAPNQSGLDDAESATPKFTPDVPGYYVITVVVDGATTYVLRLAVVAAAVASQAQGINLLPLADSQVPTPQTGVTIYYSTDLGAPAKKNTAGTVSAL